MKKKLLLTTMLAVSMALCACGTDSKNDSTETSVESTETTVTDVTAVEESTSTYETVDVEGLEKDWQLKTTSNTAAVKEFSEFAEMINGKVTAIDTIDFTLTDAEGNSVEPNGEVTVTINKSDLKSGSGDSYIVYYLNPEQSVAQAMETTVTDTTVSFKTTHFSTYSILQYNSEKVADTYFEEIGDIESANSKIKEAPEGEKALEDYKMYPYAYSEWAHEQGYYSDSVTISVGENATQTTCNLIYMCDTAADAPTEEELKRDIHNICVMGDFEYCTDASVYYQDTNTAEIIYDCVMGGDEKLN